VTWDADLKDHFVIVDTVGVVDHPKLDPKALDRQPAVSLKKLLGMVASGADDEDILLTLAGRLSRLQKRATAQDETAIAAATGGLTLHDIITQLLAAADPDRHLAAAQAETGRPAPSPAAIEAASARLREAAAALIGGNVKLRAALFTIQDRHEQVLDAYNVDELVEAGFDQAATHLAQTMVQSFRDFIEARRDEIAALQIIYNMPTLSLRPGEIAERRARYRAGGPPGPPQGGESRPPGPPQGGESILPSGGLGGPGGRLTFDHLKALEDEILRTHPTWTTEALWNAYAQLKQARRISSPRRLTNLISLIRCVVQLEDELIPFPDLVQQRYRDWLDAQHAAGRTFSPEQQQWLDKIAEVVGVNLNFTRRDFNDYFYAEGGLNKAKTLFGNPELSDILEELNDVLV
jgi:type I restriction enzyme R subunit